MNEGSGESAIKCPECGSKRLYRDGLGYRADGSVVQRWLCRDCGLRFRDKPKRKGGRHILNFNGDISLKRQVCVPLARGAKNLASTAQNGNPAVETNPKEVDAKGKIFEFAWWMQKQGYAAETIRLNTGALRTLMAKGADPLNPETVKEVLAKEQR